MTATEERRAARLQTQASEFFLWASQTSVSVKVLKCDFALITDSTVSL